MGLLRHHHRRPAAAHHARLHHQLPPAELPPEQGQQLTKPPSGTHPADQSGTRVDLRHPSQRVLLAQRERTGGLHLLDGGVLAALQSRGLPEAEDQPRKTK